MRGKKYDVFISYRRDGGDNLAQLLYDRLTQRGYRVFLDIESLRGGRFNKAILDTMDGCRDVIAVLPPEGLKRCADPEDWVLLELSHALKQKKNLVPVLMRGFQWPRPMPRGLEGLETYNGVADNKDYFDAVVDRLVTLLQSRPVRKIRRRTAAACLILAAALCLGIWFRFLAKPTVRESQTEPNIQTASEPAETRTAEREAGETAETEAGEIAETEARTGASRTIVALDGGSGHTVALYSDGTVNAVGDNRYGQCSLSDWTDVVQISTMQDFTVGLRSDGTVVAVGDNREGQCEVSDWTDIVMVSAGRYHTVGLRSDGTVVTAGSNSFGQCGVDGWTDMVAVAAAYSNTMGLRSDGTVVICGSFYGKGVTRTVGGWQDIQAICASDSHFLGLRENGSVAAAGNNSSGQCGIETWRDAVDIDGGAGFTVGLFVDGRVVVEGINDQKQTDACAWRDMALIGCGIEHIVGMKTDGTLVSVGDNSYGERDLEALLP